MLGMNKWIDQWKQEVTLFPVLYYRAAAQKAYMLACSYFRPGNSGNTASHNTLRVLGDILMDLNMAKYGFVCLSAREIYWK